LPGVGQGEGAAALSHQGSRNQPTYRAAAPCREGTKLHQKNHGYRQDPELRSWDEDRSRPLNTLYPRYPRPIPACPASRGERLGDELDRPHVRTGQKAADLRTLAPRDRYRRLGRNVATLDDIAHPDRSFGRPD